MISEFFRIMRLTSINILAFVVSGFCFLLMPFFNKPAIVDRTQYIAPPTALKHLTSGLNYQIADAFWLRALQDFDYCEEKLNERDCIGKSWLFQVIDLATEIDLRFEPNLYQFSGLALTVLVSDYAGASIIFDKGVGQHPTYWPLVYAAAYHAQFEEKNSGKAAQLYSLAADNGAPSWTRILAGRLAKEAGDDEFAEKVLQSMIELNQDIKFIERLKDKLKALQAARTKK